MRISFRTTEVSRPFAPLPAMAHVQKFAEILEALQSQCNEKRQQAESLYQQATTTEPEQVVAGLVGVLGATQFEPPVRQQAAVLLRQLVNHRDDKKFAFAKCTASGKAQVAAELLRLFEAEATPKMQKKIGEVVAKLADTVCNSSNEACRLSEGVVGWPALLPLVFRMSDPTQNGNAASCEAALRLMKELVTPMDKDIVAAQQQLGSILQACLAHADTKLKVAALLLVCEIVCTVDKKAWAPLVATANVLLQVLQQTAQAGLHENLEECLQAYNDVVQTEPDFFKQQLTSCMEPAKFMSQLVKTREGLENGIRNQALDWLANYTVKKHKWLAKHLPALPALAVECCMDLMIEVEDGQEELNAWIERMDDEEGEEDADELYQVGSECIDRVAETVGMENIGPTLFAVIGKYSNLDAWQAKFAALGAIKQTVEYVEEDEHVNEMAKLLMAHLDHPHPRVRYMALHAIGQLANDQAPHFQDAWHQTLLPQLFKKIEDPIDRVSSMAMSAFVSFGEELDKALMLQYSPEFMKILVSKLQSSTHRMVQEESITSIAVIAGVIEKDFSEYYDGMMPLLKNFVMTATGEKQSRLRGKAFECMSLLGASVGKEKFLPDARQALSEMMKMPAEADDLQRDYIIEASQRICKCLGKDFAPFLPEMLPGIFKSLKVVSDDDGSNIQTTMIEEANQSHQMLWTFCDEMKGGFYDWVQPTAEALLPFISSSDNMGALDGEACDTWALLIKCARAGAEERNLQTDIPQQLLATYLQNIVVVMSEEKDPELLQQAATGISECLKNAGPGVLNGDEVMQLVDKLFKFIDESFQRSAEEERAKQEEKAGAPPELQDEDDEDEPEDEEENCRRACEDAVGSVMEVAPAAFLQCLPQVGPRLQQWLASKQNKTLGLFLACDMLKNLKEESKTVWPLFMPVVFQSLTDADHDVRIAAAYAVNLASSIPLFGEAAPEAFRIVAQIVAAKEPKKRDEKAKLARDNAVAALLALARGQAALCPPEVKPWQLVVSKLPLQEDYEEACKVHDIIVDLLIAQDAGLLGPNGEHLGKILSALAEVYKQEHLCEKETDEKIRKVFQMIPQDKLIGLAPSFSEKQQKKIERMLSADVVVQHGG